MTSKTHSRNLGIPLFVDPQADIVTKSKATTDSWYVKFNFRAGDREIAFEWHQMTIRLAPFVKFSVTDFLLMDASRGAWLEHTDSGLAYGKRGAAAGQCRVMSRFGGLEGNAEALTLRVTADDGGVDLMLRPRKEVVYNGSVGLLPILGATYSYQYAYPNMDVSGTIRINGETFEVRDTTAWLDRQWTNAAPSQAFPSWMWLGMTLNPERTAAISLWDISHQKSSERRSFATLLDERGVQANHVANIAYEHTWKSDRTGNSYPGAIAISIPTADIELTLEPLIQRTEFVKGVGPMKIAGSQTPCSVRGRYGSISIDCVEILELIGDVCGAH